MEPKQAAKQFPPTSVLAGPGRDGPSGSTWPGWTCTAWRGYAGVGARIDAAHPHHSDVEVRRGTSGPATTFPLGAGWPWSAEGTNQHRPNYSLALAAGPLQASVTSPSQQHMGAIT